MSELNHCIAACLQNGEKLIDQVQLYEFEDAPHLKYYLSIISQEELSKSFLLYLVEKEIVPWNKYIHRALNDHSCKQLIGVVIDYLSPDLDSFLAWSIQSNGDESKWDIPKRVCDAINILRYEKIDKWKSKSWVWEVAPDYDSIAKRISNREADKLKQKSIYVEVSADGRIISTPKFITNKMANEELERAKRFLSFGLSVSVNYTNCFINYFLVESALRKLFSNVNTES